MTTQLPTRQQIDRAAPLDFPDRSEKQANITIKAGPLGLVVKVEYTGPLSGIPAAIERLRSAGVLELVSAGKVAPVGTSVNQFTEVPSPSRKPAGRVSAAYNGAGEPCCPVHTGRVLKQGQYGPYCSAKDRETGEYCKLKFKD